MVQRPGRSWGLRALVFAGVIVWEIYDLASARLFASNEGDTLRYIVIGAALCGLVVSLVKLSVDY
jgi:hypothetical protein